MFYRPIGKMMVDQRKMFLSQKAVGSFGGYATQQLRRLQAALARDPLLITCSKFVLPSKSVLELKAHPRISMSDPSTFVPYE